METKRKVALQKGDILYFNGNPCKHGHVATRRAVNGCCTECERIKNNKKGRKQYMAAYAEQNCERVREIARQYIKNNRGKVNARTAKRHAAKMQRTPKWLSKEEKTRIQCYYQIAAMRTKETGESWHVDHIIPMQGSNVCGLHVPWNLQVIPATDNIGKNNRFYG